jgi:hypothetical protein
MIVTLHMSMPEGDAMRQRFGDLMEAMKRDNRCVISAMLSNGLDVPDTVGEIGLEYIPETHRLDERGQPILEIFGYRDMVSRGTFSCGDASAYEAAVLEEKYGVPTLCIAVAQGDDDMHAIFVTSDNAVDPTANFLSGRRSPIPAVPNPVPGTYCTIEDGRVVCIEEDMCGVGEDGVWYCPAVPGLSGRRAAIQSVRRTGNGQAWARTADGAVVPVRRQR